MFDDPKPNTPCRCPMCKWDGAVKDCEKRWYESSGKSWRMLAGRSGWQWHCPKCDFAVRSEWVMMS